MTAPSVIHTESLGKNYRRGLQQSPGLRHALEDFARKYTHSEFPVGAKISEASPRP